MTHDPGWSSPPKKNKTKKNKTQHRGNIDKFAKIATPCFRDGNRLNVLPMGFDRDVIPRGHNRCSYSQTHRAQTAKAQSNQKGIGMSQPMANHSRGVHAATHRQPPLWCGQSIAYMVPHSGGQMVDSCPRRANGGVSFDYNGSWEECGLPSSSDLCRAKPMFYLDSHKGVPQRQQKR